MNTTATSTDTTSSTTRRTADLKVETTYVSADDLSEALIRAATAHGEHEKRTGEYDEQWPVWYAAYMVAERNGTQLPE